MAGSKIEWTTNTWNPVTGCTKISAGCKRCYAERMARRLKGMQQEKYLRGFQVSQHPDVLLQPLGWKSPKIIFVNSMSDTFHKDVEEDYILRIFETMNKADWHIFQVLTKRSERMLELSKKINWTKNIWLGVTVEDNDNKYRINDLVKTPAKTKFLSCEPLIGPLDNLNLSNIDWVIVGGESGSNERVLQKKWVTNLRDQCVDEEIPFFFKQWGGYHKKRNGRLLEGETWEQMPN